MNLYRAERIYEPEPISTAARLGEVLAITAGGFAVTAIGTRSYWDVGPKHAGWLILLCFALIFVMKAVREIPVMALGVFALFCYCEGATLGPALSHYAHVNGSGKIAAAAYTTAAGMIILGLISWATSLDWRKYYSFAVGALLVLCIVGVASALFHFVNPNLYSWATLAVFSLLVLIDFARIKDSSDSSTSVEMALEIYLDALNIFLAVLQLIGDNDDD